MALIIVDDLESGNWPPRKFAGNKERHLSTIEFNVRFSFVLFLKNQFFFRSLNCIYVPILRRCTNILMSNLPRWASHVDRTNDGDLGETRIWFTLALLCPNLPYSSLPKPTVSFSASARPFCTQSRVSGRAICNSGGTHRRRTGLPKNCRCIICNSKEHRNLRSVRGRCGKKGQADDEIEKGW